MGYILSPHFIIGSLNNKAICRPDAGQLSYANLCLCLANPTSYLTQNIRFSSLYTSALAVSFQIVYWKGCRDPSLICFIEDFLLSYFKVELKSVKTETSKTGCPSKMSLCRSQLVWTSSLIIMEAFWFCCCLFSCCGANKVPTTSQNSCSDFLLIARGGPPVAETPLHAPIKPIR